MNQAELCLDDREADRLLCGEVNADRVCELEQHLVDCFDCRQLLQQQVGDEDWWDDIESSLRFGLSHRQVDATDRFSPQQLVDLLGPTDDPNMLGRIGPYEIIGILGQGGMGAVFKGFDRSLNRFVAIKMLLPHLAVSGAARKRFAREGQAVAAVVDDHVMAVHCVDQWQEIPYLVMTYARGESLQKRLANNGPLELREILRIGMQTAKGLAAAHAQGIVHRDVKPANIFLVQNVERVQLMDFGLARAVDDASLTRSGTIAGTPQYMSPEQARAESVDHRSDLFSLGSVMYAMCTGRPPFRDETSLGVMRLISEQQARPIQEVNSDVPIWLCRIIDVLMSKQASDRFQSAEELAELLEQCLAHVQQPADVPLPDAPLLNSDGGCSQPPRRWNRMLLGGLAGFFGLLAIVVITIQSGKGTIRIESDSDNVPLIIKKDGKEYDKLTVHRIGKSISVSTGAYEIVFEGEFNQFTIDNGAINLQRGKESVVQIREAETSPEPEGESGLRSKWPFMENVEFSDWRKQEAGRFGDLKIAQAVTLAIPLDTTFHSDELLSANVGSQTLSLIARSAAEQSGDDRSTSDSSFAYAHLCELLSYEPGVREGKKVWSAKFMVPTEIRINGARLRYSRSQKELESMLEAGVQFRLDRFSSHTARTTDSSLDSVVLRPGSNRSQLIVKAPANFGGGSVDIRETTNYGMNGQVIESNLLTSMSSADNGCAIANIDLAELNDGFYSALVSRPDATYEIRWFEIRRPANGSVVDSPYQIWRSISDPRLRIVGFWEVQREVSTSNQLLVKSGIANFRKEGPGFRGTIAFDGEAPLDYSYQLLPRGDWYVLELYNGGSTSVSCKFADDNESAILNFNDTALEYPPNSRVIEEVDRWILKRITEPEYKQWQQEVLPKTERMQGSGASSSMLKR